MLHVCRYNWMCGYVFWECECYCYDITLALLERVIVPFLEVDNIAVCCMIPYTSSLCKPAILQGTFID